MKLKKQKLSTIAAAIAEIHLLDKTILKAHSIDRKCENAPAQSGVIPLCLFLAIMTTQYERLEIPYSSIAYIKYLTLSN